MSKTCCSETAASAIEALDKEIREKQAQLAQLRRSNPEPVKEYEFAGHDAEKIKLSQLFGSKKDLIVIHNMGTRCPYCTMWADGFNGLVAHLEDRAAFVVVSNDDVEAQKKFKQSRGWKFAMVSSKGTDFFKDMGFYHEESNENTKQYGHFGPGVSTFRRTTDGAVERVAHASFGPGDNFCVTWNLFDLLENGPSGWEAKFSY